MDDRSHRRVLPIHRREGMAFRAVGLERSSDLISKQTACAPAGRAKKSVTLRLRSVALVTFVAAAPALTIAQATTRPAAEAVPATQPATQPAIVVTIRPATAPVSNDFPTATAAVEAFVAAARSPDGAAMLGVLGPDGEDVVDSGDPVADAAGRAGFARAFDAKHELVADESGTVVTLLVGERGWPMPIPIVQKSPGHWRFDTAAGRDEILNRRIGRNELDAMKVLLAVVDAQREYALLNHNLGDPDGDAVPAYAERFASTPGRRDGLYWPQQPGDVPSPLGPLFVDAAAEGYGSATRPSTNPAVGPKKPYHGYFYRILTKQTAAAVGGEMDYHLAGKLVGGFAVVAWPADYANAGVMTFIVNHDGVIYQRDLGQATADKVAAMNAFDPSAEWTRVEDAPPATRPQ